MAQQFSVIEVNSRFGVTVPNVLITQEPASMRLLVILPGQAYTIYYPVLYYLRRMALQQGFDVLGVQYGFQINNQDFKPEQTPYLLEDTAKAVEPVLKRNYQQVCLAGKSLGTPLAVEVAKLFTSAQVSLLLLTPIAGALQNVGKARTLAVIGTADALYSPDEVAAYAAHPHVKWRVFDGLNHSLEAKDNWQRSLEALPQVIAACETFLTSD